MLASHKIYKRKDNKSYIYEINKIVEEMIMVNKASVEKKWNTIKIYMLKSARKSEEKINKGIMKNNSVMKSLK